MQTQTMSHARISVIRLLGSGCGNLRRRHLRVLAPVTFKTMSDLPTRDFSLSSRRLLPAGDSKPLVNIAGLFGKSPQGGATAKRSRNSVAPSHKRESACGRVDDRDWVHNDDDAVVEADMRKFDLWVAEIEAFVAAGDRRVDAAEWDAFRSRLLAADPTRVKVIDGVVMKKCVQTLHHAVGESFIDYLRRDGGAPNLAVVAHYAALCGRCGDAAGVVAAYEQLAARYPVFDTTTCDLIAPALCATPRWRDAVAVVAATGRVDVVGARAYNAVVAAAFRARDLDTGWATIGEATRAGKSIQADVYEEWLRLCVAAREEDAGRGEEMMLGLLQFLRDKRIYVPLDAVTPIRGWFESKPDENWVVKYATVSKAGECSACAAHLEPINISGKDFEKMRTTFMERVVKGEDTFLNSTPEEVGLFKRFVETTAPYDVVVDGLNVGYQQAGRHATHTDQAKMLYQVTEYLAKTRGKKVLVLGRRHMNGWPKKYMAPIQQMAHCFLAENLSKDDPFLLYAAMYSGLGTVFLSKDMMRDHLFKLGEEFDTFFRKWQWSHQLQLLHIKPGGAVRLKAPMKFDTLVQRKGDAWHIPYESGVPRYSYEVPDTWLCATKRASDAG